MASKKGNRIQVILECTEHKNPDESGSSESGKSGSGKSGSGKYRSGISRYITTKNKKNTPERLERMKYNPILRRKTLHKEIK